MAAFDQCEITTLTLADQLRFRVVRKRGWITRLIAPAILLLMLLSGWQSGYLLWPIIAILGFASYFTILSHGNETELRVTSREFAATGNLERMFRTEITVPASEVMWVGFDAEDEGPSGLFVRKQWTSVCLLPGLTREQASQVAETIFDHFPQFDREDRVMPTLLGGTTEFITLNLKDRKSRVESDSGSQSDSDG